MKYLSLFSGIGGFELGIQQAYESLHNLRPIQQTNSKRPDSSGNTTNELQQWECVGYSEIDKYAIATYQSHFPEHHNYGDITKINEQELPDFDMLVGGFPCQAFSIAGKRKGFEDTRGTLFFDIARIIKAKQPRLVFLENVKGLLSHDNGETFRTIIATLDELGYDIQWQVLNSKNHGVPQNRERVFIIGHLRGTSRPEVFPFTGSIEQIGDGIKVIGTLETDGWEKRFEQIRRVHGTDGIVPTIPTGTGGGVMTKIAIAAMRGRNPENSSDRTVGAPTEQRLEVNQNGTSNTLTSVGKDNLVLEDMKIRRLTPIECERLQGFPDNWTIGSDTQRYKQCGNAVTVNVIKDIMERLI
jgi:DNA (cytosine-5)-methyltransferase 1